MCFNSGCKIYFPEHSFQKLILKTFFVNIQSNIRELHCAIISPSLLCLQLISSTLLLERTFFHSLFFLQSYSYFQGNHFWGLGLRGLKPPQEQEYQKPIPKVPIRTFSLQIFKSPFHTERQMAPLLAISLLSEIVVTQSVSHNPFTANFEQRDPKREFRPSSRLVAHTVSIFGQQCSLLHRTY